MADASMCGDEVSEDWALINFHPNEDSQRIPPDEFLVMGNSDESVSNEKCGGVLESNTSSEIPHTIKLNNTFSEDGSLNGPLSKLEVINLISKRNSIHERNSEDGDSIEVLDLDGSYRDAEFSELDTPDTSDTGNLEVDDLGQGICANDCITLETKLKKRTLSKTDKTTAYTTLSDSKNSREGEEEENKEDLTVALYKSKFTPVYGHHSARFKNAVLSLSLGIIIAGMVCIAIGHILGIQNSTDDLLMIVRKLKLENAALQSQLTQISTALLTEGKPMDYFVEEKQGSRLGFRDPPAKTSETFKCEKSYDSFCGVYLVDDENGQINLKTSGNRSCDKNVVNLGKLARYIQGKVNLVNDTSKDANTRNLEVCTGKITQALQAALDKLASSQKNLDDLYNKFDVFFSEIQCNGGGKNRGEKGEVSDLLEAKNLTRVRRNEQTQFVPLQFPQPEEYYMKKERNGGVAGGSSDGENCRETTKISGALESGKKKNTNDGVGMYRNKREESESKKRKKMTQKSYGKERKTMRAGKDENPGKSKKRRAKNWKGSKSSVGYRLQGSATEEGRSALSKGKSLRKSGLWVFKWAEAREKIRKAEACESGNGDWHVRRLNGRKHPARENPLSNW